MSFYTRKQCNKHNQVAFNLFVGIIQPPGHCPTTPQEVPISAGYNRSWGIAHHVTIQ